jgi:hypothetical protein
MTKIAIVGSRGYGNELQVRLYVQSLPKDVIVVSGGARGVDSWAVDEAKKCGLETQVFKADWSQGRGAGFARNSDIVKASDEVVAFWDGLSSGTQDTIWKARVVGKPVTVIREES